MIIQCTKKLLDQLKKKSEPSVEGNPLISWHANILTINRRKVVVIVNDGNRYAIVLHGLKAKDFNKMDHVILKAIQKTFEEECIKDDVIEKFIDSSKNITFTKTKDRKLVARMNKACELVYFWWDMLDQDTIYQPAMSRQISSQLVGDGENSYFYPNEKMFKDLEEFANMPIIETEAFELKVTLLMEKYHVSRRIIIPSNMTFSKLHEVLQIVLGWQNYHLHEFYIYESKSSNQPHLLNHPAYDGEGFKPIVNLVCDEEAFSYGDDDIEMKMDTTIKLSEYLPAKVKYIYDFGDNWRHDIEVVKVIDNYAKNYPTCLEGKGDIPPEDVGGEGGYEEFMEIIADESHQDYEHMKNWSRRPGYKGFNLDIVNKRLKRS